MVNLILQTRDCPGGHGSECNVKADSALYEEDILRMALE